jgi:hypothetical protein
MNIVIVLYSWLKLASRLGEKLFSNESTNATRSRLTEILVCTDACTHIECIKLECLEQNMAIARHSLCSCHRLSHITKFSLYRHDEYVKL